MNKTTVQSKTIKIAHNNEIITDNAQIANLFGSYFSTIVKEQLRVHFGSKLSMNCTTGKMVNETFFFFPTSSDEVEKVISALPNKKSTGIDEVPIYLIKKCKSEISPLISKMLNISFEETEFPPFLKQSLVIPIYKKDDPLAIENYRPISLLSTISKIIEKIVINRIDNFLNKFKILRREQHGFRAEHSTETAVTEFVQHVYDLLDRKEYVLGFFFDLSRAFDCLNFELILTKMQTLGLRGKIMEWIESYLRGRTMKIKIKDVFSSVYEIDSGVIQGSTAGPKLFLLYVNDLPEHISFGRVFLYADDTSIVISAPTMEELSQKANTVISDVSEWCIRNNLILNQTKTVCLNFRKSFIPKNENFTVKINSEHVLIPEETVKFLGVRLHSELNWMDHVEEICKKLNSGYYALLNLKQTLNKQGLMSAYYALIYSRISYNIIV